MPNGATYYVEGVTAESLVKESRRPTSETAPSAVRLIQKLKSATALPAFTENLSSGNTNLKKVDEYGKLYFEEGVKIVSQERDEV